jgi:formamidopyrimidine-DNA glycosylase
VLREPRSDVRFLRAVIRLGGGTTLLFTDARRFGTAVVLDDAELDAYMAARAGVEPLSERLTAERICELAAGRRAPLKSFLMVQDGIAGIGNIYADEALWRARLHPLSPAGSMRLEHCERLREGIVGAIEAGLDNGGASIDDYRDARGAEGTMQDEFCVHNREGQPCPRCGTEIRRIVLGGRSTYFCPGCQQRLRRRRRRKARRRPAAAPANR